MNFEKYLLNYTYKTVSNFTQNKSVKISEIQQNTFSIIGKPNYLKLTVVTIEIISKSHFIHSYNNMLIVG